MGATFKTTILEWHAFRDATSWWQHLSISLPQVLFYRSGHCPTNRHHYNEILRDLLLVFMHPKTLMSTPAAFIIMSPQYLNRLVTKS